MLYTILVVLLVLWLLGLVSSVGGAAIHLLLVLAVVVHIAVAVRKAPRLCRYIGVM